MDRLDELKAHSIFIFREAFARLRKLALPWSLGKRFARGGLARAHGL